MPRTVISTPYPTIKKTAKELGVGKQRTRQLYRLMDAISGKHSVDLIFTSPSGENVLIEVKRGKVATKPLKRGSVAGRFVLKRGNRAGKRSYIVMRSKAKGVRPSR